MPESAQSFWVRDAEPKTWDGVEQCGQVWRDMFWTSPKMGTLSFSNVAMPFCASFRARVWGVEMIRAPGVV